MCLNKRGRCFPFLRLVIYIGTNTHRLHYVAIAQSFSDFLREEFRNSDFFYLCFWLRLIKGLDLSSVNHQVHSQNVGDVISHRLEEGTLKKMVRANESVSECSNTGLCKTVKVYGCCHEETHDSHLNVTGVQVFRLQISTEISHS